MTEANLTQSDLDYVIALSDASLAKTPQKDNWVDYAGELPSYIRRIANDIHESGGKTVSQAIAIAVSRVKKWAAGGDNVKADTRAKAAKALAEWEALKAKSKARKVAKLSAQTGKWEILARPVEIIALSGPSYNIDNIRNAYDKQMREARKSMPGGSVDAPWFYVREVWNTHLIVADDYGNDKLFKVNYTVDANGNPTFEKPVEVVIEYVEAGKDVSDNELAPAS